MEYLSSNPIVGLSNFYRFHVDKLSWSHPQIRNSDLFQHLVKHSVVANIDTKIFMIFDHKHAYVTDVDPSVEPTWHHLHLSGVIQPFDDTGAFGFSNGSRIGILSHHNITYIHPESGSIEILKGGGNVPPLIKQTFVFVPRNNLIYAFGGIDQHGIESNSMYTINIDTGEWQDVQQQGNIPDPRYGHTMIVMGTQLILSGGRGTQFFNDVCIFNMDWTSWTKWNSIPGPWPFSRGFAPACRYKSSAVILGGGFKGASIYNDFVVLRMGMEASLCTDLGKAINNPTTADMVIQVEGKMIYAHRAICAVRSPYFWRYFRENPMGDGSHGNCIQVNMDSFNLNFQEVFKMIQFLYTGSLDWNEDLDRSLELCQQFEMTKLVEDMRQDRPISMNFDLLNIVHSDVFSDLTIEGST
eukprot:TRINITY_DN4038_c0_g1_i2.p1 TRINITY_DN4038_c0_g1~~TRINITY_DN4038_c0_g1_i2.p1  ORF type:complete len:458 (+),score=120.94 TRINITY_DN4038_c0_g1_i2:144-1376(+)